MKQINQKEFIAFFTLLYHISTDVKIRHFKMFSIRFLTLFQTISLKILKELK